MNKGKYDINYLWISLVAAVFFLPFLGVVHLFDWDEINFAESAREMIVSGDYFSVMINFTPFWEKPPLFFWFQVVCMKIFGINEFAARLPNAIFGIITLNTLYFLGKKLHNVQFGMIWLLTFGGALLPFFYFKSGIIDPVFNYFIFLSVYFLYKTVNSTEKKYKYALLGGVFNGLAVLTKGPVGLLLLLLTYIVILALEKFRKLPQLKEVLLFAGAWVIVTFLWYGFELIQNGPWFLVEFVKYQIDLFLNPVAGHQQPIYYHFVVVFIGCFPFSVLALPAFRRNFNGHDDFRKWIKVLFWVVMILFTIVTTKIVHYSSMAYLPLSYLGASVIYHYAAKGISPVLRWIFLIMGLVVALIFTALPLLLINKDWLISTVKDQFVLDSLQVEVPMGGWEWSLGLVYLAIVVWTFFSLKKDLIKSIWKISLGTGVFLWFVMVLIVPKVERYSQGPHIDFLKSLEGKDVYVKNTGFKSYAEYYYFRQPIYEHRNYDNLEWLLYGEIDKPVYIITKSTYTSMDTVQTLELIEQRGGFRFYKRE